MKAIIRSIGHFHPGSPIPNSFFDTLAIGSDADWVQDRTGIRSRYSVISEDDIRSLKCGSESLESLREKGRVLSIADIAEKSWALLLERLGPSTPHVDTLICGTSIPDYDIPANACTIAARLGLNCTAFDVNSACSSFVVDLHVAKGLLHSSDHGEIAVFNPERYSLRINYEDRNSAVLFGDGCSSALVTNQDEQGLEILDTYICSDPSKYETVQIPDGRCFSQVGHAVQKFAITRTIEVTQTLLERNHLLPEDLAYFAGHQANLRMVESAASRLGIPGDRHLFNVDAYGNQGSAGAPSVLSQNWDRFKSGDYIMIAVVGSGLTWGAALLRKI